MEEQITILPSIGRTEIQIAVIVSIVSYLFIDYYKKKKNLPPGPIGLPVVGCFLYIRKDPHLKLQQMARKYGDVFSLYVGTRFVVVLNGVDAIKEGMNKMEFMGRPTSGDLNLGDNESNIVALSGKDFHEQRKFMLHSMRDLGFGKTVMEECMKVELEHFLRAVEETNGQPYDVRTVLTPSVSNNITALVYGARYDYQDSRRKLLDGIFRDAEDFAGQTAFHIYFPWITRIPFARTFFGYQKASNAIMRSLTFSSNRIDEHKKTLDANHTRDYIDKFLLEMQRVQEKHLKDSSFTEPMLIGNVGALLGAGSETVHTTLNWCLLFMATYQEVQKRVQEEIDAIIGLERMSAYADQKQMPYTHAVIMEIMRYRTIVALNVPRCALEDTTFRGYDIPKETIILANMWSAHYDTRYWKDPEKFNPERFLSADQQSVVKSEAFMPFSVGRRSCPGETMAVVEVFMYFSTILQRFHIRLPDGVLPDLEGKLYISYQPKPQNLCFKSRFSM